MGVRGARVEVLCVGTELLSGKVNTHVAYLARELQAAGLTIGRESSVLDGLGEISDGVREAFARCDVLLICGGLGPTFDDLTREGTAAALGLPLLYRPALYAGIRRRLRRYHVKIPGENKRQAFVINGAEPLANRRGSAPGQWLELGEKVVILLPGPFQELSPMFEGLLPRLKARYAPRVFTRKKVFKLCGIVESAADERLRPLTSRPRPGLDLTILAQIGLVDFHVSARADDAREAARLLSRAERSVRRLVGGHIYGTDDETLESVIGRLLDRRGLKVATAESCTGGLVSEKLTSVPGSSRYFVGGVVAYSNELKRSELGVSEATLEASGAVSESCAREMAEGAVRRLGADCALSITGIAGPGGGSRAKPVGLTFIGLARRGHPTQVRKYLFFGSREQIRSRAAVEALTLLFRSLI